MKQTKTLYALIFKDSGEILTPDSFKEHWPNYGGSWLQGWRPPKKVYYKIGHAKSGFSHIPDQIKPSIAIAEFTVSKIIEDGKNLVDKQKKSAKIKEIKQQISNLKYKRKIYEEKKKDLENYKNDLKKLEMELKKYEN